jgi:hypothetical protein
MFKNTSLSRRVERTERGGVGEVKVEALIVNGGRGGCKVAVGFGVAVL